MSRAIKGLMGTGVALMALALASTASAETLAITGARVLSAGAAGDVAEGTVLIRNGRIAAIGTDVVVPSSARVIEAKGRVVTPGLFASGTALGLNEVSSVQPSDDSRNLNQTTSAAFDVAAGFNPASANIPPARQGGVTRAVTLPRYANEAGRQMLFAGQGAMVALDGQAPDVRAGVLMVLDAGEDGASRAGGARGAEVGLLRRNLDDAALYARKRADYERGTLRSLSLSQPDLEALQPVLAGRQPLLVGVSRVSDIRLVLELARERGLKVILNGAEEGWMIADEIAAAGVGVVINPTSNLPLSYEVLGARLDNAARLHAAGVRLAFVSNDTTHRVRELRYNAGIAVAHGLPYEAAIAAITRHPAELYGAGRELGSLDVGKLADLVIWSGDPLEPSSHAERVFIAGREQDVSHSRPTLLARKYYRSQAATAAGQETP